MALPQLYQAEWCPDSKKVRTWATDNLVEYQLINVPRARESRDALFQVSGQRFIPTLVDGDTVISDNADAIIAYLAKQK